ncbi:MAG: LTA synthase family protein [Clostridia bacterium]|nr:LTA synthase family protein [Clostridia bacterium]
MTQIKQLFRKIAYPFKKIRRFWLFGKDFKALSLYKKIIYVVFHSLLMLTFAVALGFLSLSLSYGEAYSKGIFTGFLGNGYILALNLLPPVLLMMLFYAITSRAWLAFALDSFFVIGFTAANFYLLRFRDDPLMFSDILLMKEAASISKEGYDYTPSRKLFLCIVICVVMTLFLAIFCAARLNIFARLAFLALPVMSIFLLKDVYFDTEIYDIKTQNFEHINRWSSTQVYVSKGFIYPFIHSISESFGQPPANYSQEEAELILSRYEQEYIEDEKKVNVIAIMLEAYCDLENIGVEGINPDVYSVYRKLREENYSGTLITNIFAGGTVDSERAFLTGYADLDNYRTDVNSYVRSFNRMGYYTTGSHPSQDWFYNRKNINKYLGFEDYLFSENYFYEKYGDNMRLDSIAFPEFYKSYEQAISKSDKPYFAFHVTYQGHGPYSAQEREWGDGTNYYNENISQADNYIIDNYLGSLKDTGWQIDWFVNQIKQSTEPCVVVLFGDHKPWLGDGNSVYNALGVNLDVSTEEGFRNYYGTEYVMIANDKAKQILKDDFSGQGPVTSPCMLMSVLFDKLGIRGDSFMRYTRNVRQSLPAFNLVGAYDKDGNYYTLGTMPADLASIYNEYMRVSYYRSTTNAE